MAATDQNAGPEQSSCQGAIHTWSEDTGRPRQEARRRKGAGVQDVGPEPCVSHPWRAAAPSCHRRANARLRGYGSGSTRGSARARRHGPRPDPRGSTGRDRHPGRRARLVGSGRDADRLERRATSGPAADTDDPAGPRIAGRGPAMPACSRSPRGAPAGRATAGAAHAGHPVDVLRRDRDHDRPRPRARRERAAVSNADETLGRLPLLSRSLPCPSRPTCRRPLTQRASDQTGLTAARTEAMAGGPASHGMPSATAPAQSARSPIAAP